MGQEPQYPCENGRDCIRKLAEIVIDFEASDCRTPADEKYFERLHTGIAGHLKTLRKGNSPVSKESLRDAAKLVYHMIRPDGLTSYLQTHPGATEDAVRARALSLLNLWIPGFGEELSSPTAEDVNQLHERNWLMAACARVGKAAQPKNKGDRTIWNRAGSIEIGPDDLSRLIDETPVTLPPVETPTCTDDQDVSLGEMADIVDDPGDEPSPIAIALFLSDIVSDIIDMDSSVLRHKCLELC
jgi:hypothetical protein